MPRVKTSRRAAPAAHAGPARPVAAAVAPAAPDAAPGVASAASPRWACWSLVGAACTRSAAAQIAERTARRRDGARSASRVRDVVIEGRQKTPEPLLRAALGVHARRPDPRLLGSTRRARGIETINWVQSATVERRLPGTIVVQLHRAAAVRGLAARGQASR